MICPHIWGPCEHEHYQKCSLCASYHSLKALPPEEIYLDGYWSSKQNHGTITDQVHNVDVHLENGVTKNQFVLNNLNPPDKEFVIEIGCAPGVLLTRLKEFGFKDVIGIEADPDYKQAIRSFGHQGTLIFGLFPTVTIDAANTNPGASSIIALDVLEHCFDPKAFLAECARLLKSGGQVFLMLPLATSILPKRFFHPVEHVYIHSRQHLRELLLEVGFRKIRLDAWTAGHETVSAYKG